MATRKKSAGKQRLYKMKGCNKKGCKKSMKRTRKYRGGSNMNMYLAYPSNNVPTVPNPHMAYLGGNAGYPNQGPPAGGFNFLNPQQTQRGGCGGCGMKGGMKGGSGNNGIPYPNGLVGSSWTPNISTWPGVNGISGDSNYLALNKYPVDPQTAMISVGAQAPFTGGKKRRTQKGGNLSNLFTQDLINLGRQIQYGVGSAYNGISGYPSPVSPLPWKGQLQSVQNVKAYI
jgi:hypothetical protein